MRSRKLGLRVQGQCNEHLHKKKCSRKTASIRKLHENKRIKRGGKFRDRLRYFMLLMSSANPINVTRLPIDTEKAAFCRTQYAINTLRDWYEKWSTSRVPVICEHELILDWTIQEQELVLDENAEEHGIIMTTNQTQKPCFNNIRSMLS